MINSATYFRNLLDKAVYAGGRDLMFNIRLDVPTFGLHIKNSKNQVNFLDMENPFIFKKHLKNIIEHHSRPNERATYVNAKGEYHFDRIIFNMRFSTPEVQSLFGHGFNLSVVVQDKGRVITGAFTVKHTDSEWAVYEKQCQDNLKNVKDKVATGEFEIKQA
ncbi:hypothetical protein HNW13_017675 [Shewanella sp. BF02_Schw]|uniref:hypothetical protein n=1 Tax=Shewanella sp. BF02_Schw TaxID=394908 RepID=UPI0017872CA7|nr:hypothetical protein [Shewanella sp. BF02_Schw]MBO1897569.1 hypothetical protein [Shewanella sp. BF02_Schw]